MLSDYCIGNDELVKDLIGNSVCFKFKEVDMSKINFCLIIAFFLSCSNKNTDYKQGLKSSENNKGLENISTEGDTLWVDASNSNLQWVGKKVTGEHSGKVDIAGGYIVFRQDKIQSGEILVNMRTITVDDIENPKWNKKLVDHLKNDDFFNTQKFPTARIEILDSKQTNIDNIFTISANLSIRDKTNSIQFDIMLDNNFATGSLIVDRSEFGIKYKSAKFFDDLGDKLIYDDFNLNFSIFAK